MKERRNLFPNPRFIETGAQPFTGNAKWYRDVSADAHNNLNVRKTSSSDGYESIAWKVKLDVGVEYVFDWNTWHERTSKGVELQAQNDDGGRVYVVGDWTSGEKTNQTPGHTTFRFSLPTGFPYLLLWFNSAYTYGDNVSYWQPLLELASTYDAAVNAGGYSRVLRLRDAPGVNAWGWC